MKIKLILFLTALALPVFGQTWVKSAAFRGAAALQGTPVAAAAASFAPTLVSSNIYQATATATTHSNAFPATATSGNLLVAYVGSWNGAVTNYTSGWSTAVTTNDYPMAYIFYKVSNGTETGFGVKMDASGSCTIYYQQFGGNSGTWTLDKVAANKGLGGTTSAVGPTTATTTSADELALAMFVLAEGNAAFSAWSNSFSEVYDSMQTHDDPYFLVGVAIRVLTETGTYSTTTTVTASSNHGVGLIATFK